jgi:hypothetical protein
LFDAIRLACSTDIQPDDIFYFPGVISADALERSHLG